MAETRLTGGEIERGVHELDLLLVYGTTKPLNKYEIYTKDWSPGVGKHPFEGYDAVRRVDMSMVCKRNNKES